PHSPLDRLPHSSLPHLQPDVGLFNVMKVGVEGAASLMGSVDHAPIRLSALAASHVFETGALLGARLARHYATAAIFEAYKVLGSASFIGNPVGLVTTFGRDVLSLLYQPSAGLLESPLMAGVALASSAKALVQHTAVGVLDSTSHVLASAAKGIRAAHT